MRTQLSSEFEGEVDSKEAQGIIRKCVHCGFCNATCPTYQLLGDELDGPRGSHIPDQAGARGLGSYAHDAATLGPLPDLPQLPNHLPERR